MSAETSAPIRRALISVSDKSGLAELGRFLAARDVEILSTGGSAAFGQDLQFIEVAAQQFEIHGTRRGQAQARVAGLDQGLGFVEQLLAQLFARAQAGHHDLDVLVGP